MTAKDIAVPYQEIAAAKRQSLLDNIPKEWILESIPSEKEVPNVCEYLDKFLPEEEVAITSSTVLKLADKISKGELTASNVTKAFCHRTALVHQMTSCCAEIFFDRAFHKAKELDEYYAKYGKTIGPLHGIPISLKDQFNLEGLDSAIGYISLLNKPFPKEQESVLADILSSAGAIFFVKTTVPTAMMAGDTVSNIYGYTKNSINRKLSCGGSSGGEGCLIGARGALLGFGTDIGGSVRIPSAFQGIYGLRPSSHRITYRNVTNSYCNQPVMVSVIGPMAQDLEDIKFIFKFIVESKQYLRDPKVPPIPYREVSLKPTDKLCFGIMKWNKYIMPHPPILRAIETAKTALLKAGHEVVEWEPPVSHLDLLNLASAIFGADNCKEMLNECAKSGEPLIKEDIALCGGKAGGPSISIEEHWEQAGLRYKYQQIYDDFWLSTKTLTTTGRPIDGLISPSWETCSFKSGDFPKLTTMYTSVFNVLDYSVVVTPITKVDKKIDLINNSYKPINEMDKFTHEYYDPELFDGTPVTLQVVAPRYQEEKALFLSSTLTNALKLNLEEK
ncbi:hypothetical protein PACTADRAFT_48609 [Pachysolen tannophilus NRRL Y-2460]|uniref:amidase n=1 Tax=Pachysolen tannophilus NRRL Y-2460 TaxID=669874 RepID=A0A1E4TYH4_PACTA|nr:hypothetical protein PACTADRAFT_48609 [Pachysolen tannophilus NRRL Y-2460]